MTDNDGSNRIRTMRRPQDLRWVIYGAGGILVALLFAAPLFAPRYVMQMLITIVLYIALVAAWNIFSGFTGYLFLGVAAFYGIASYVFAIVAPMVPYFLAIPVVGVVCFVVAYVIGLLFLRIRGPYFTIASFALVLLFANLILYYEQVVTRVSGRAVVMMPLTTIYLVLLGIAVITLVMAYVLKISKFGYGLRCIRGNEDLSNVVGIDTSLYKCLSFATSAFFIGIIAASVVPRGGYIDTTIVFSTSISFNVLVMGVIGGLGSLRGGVISALVLSLAFQVFATRENPYLFFVSLGVLLTLVIFFYPKGIEGILSRFARGRTVR